jgi:1-acyl-sn-glycerol-3-phosphate acyltransferase
MPGTPATPADVERQVLEIVSGLVAELGGRAHPPALDDRLDRDLGISSLERVELVLRLERAFGVRLGDAVMADADTPMALAAAIRHEVPARGPAESAHAAAPALPPGVPAPPSTRTLIDALEWHASRTPDRVHIFLREDDGTEVPITYGRLLNDAKGTAAGLRAIGVGGGARVILMLRTEAAFFTALLGTIMAGAVPVPIYPPVRAHALADYASRQRAIVDNAGARVLITFGDVERVAVLVRGQVPALDVVTTVDRLMRIADDARLVRHEGTDTALIQYTSGSTGTPKGVVLTHDNLLANIRAIGEGIDVRPDDVGVSWLPLYHDMGLIGAWFAPLYFGVPVVLMSPLAFLARPARWLWTLHAHGGTVSPAPNFAFDLAVRKVQDEEIRGLDLSRWRLALNGSELVSPDTIDRFTRRFAPYGFRPDAMCPVYGLAEASVGLTASPLGRAPRVDRIAREPFTRTRAIVPARSDDPRPLRFVSCGRPLPRHEVVVVDADGHPLGERQEGRIRFRGPSVTRGYFQQPEATAAVVHDGWMDAGDRGYWADGELFLTGREKDLIIQGGRNISAQEVEDVAAGVAGVRQGCVAAFGVHDEARGTERLVVVAETRETADERREAMRTDITNRLVDTLGVPPDVVVIAPPGAILKTSSGKIRRGATRDAYVSGTLGRHDSTSRQWATLVLAAIVDRGRRLWRFSRRLAFSAWTAFVLAVAAPILWLRLRVASDGLAARSALRGWCRAAFRLCGVRIDVSGIEHLESVGPALIVANHASYLDPLLLLALLPGDVMFAAKRGLVAYPLIGLAIQKAGYATIEKADLAQQLAGADEVVARLGSHGCLVVFPEGTFARSPGLLPFRLGAFRAAVEATRPIVPVAIQGTRTMLPDGARLLTPGRLRVMMGAPLTPRAQGWPEMVRLRDAARDWIARETGEWGDGVMG